MTKEDKELLLRDLCARLPYGVKVQTPLMNDEITLTCGDISAYFFNRDCDITPLPYLRTMSSMTDEELAEYELLANHCMCTSVGFVHLEIQSLIDWLNAHHFDYRGLIDKGLALEAPEGMYN